MVAWESAPMAARSYADRSHQHGIRSNECVFTDGGLILVHAVVITDNSAGAHIHVGTQGGIPLLHYRR